MTAIQATGQAIQQLSAQEPVGVVQPTVRVGGLGAGGAA